MDLGTPECSMHLLIAVRTNATAAVSANSRTLHEHTWHAASEVPRQPNGGVNVRYESKNCMGGAGLESGKGLCGAGSHTNATQLCEGVPCCEGPPTWTHSCCTLSTCTWSAGTCSTGTTTQISMSRWNGVRLGTARFLASRPCTVAHHPCALA